MATPSERIASRDADVIVVGAGPAGASAAIAARRRGARVLILDRHRFPRDKPCGGGIRAGFVRRFPELAAHVRKSLDLHEIRKVIMESPSGARVCAELDGPLYLTVRRVELDAALIIHARDCGARLLEAAKVTVVERSPDGVVLRTADGVAFHAAVVIGADGVNGVVGRATGLAPGFSDDALAVDTTEETPHAALTTVDPEAIYVAYGYRGWAGYGYVFPKARHVDAGVGFLVSYYKRVLGGAPYDHHAAFLDEAGRKGIVRGGSQRERFKAYRLPLGGPLARTYDDRLLLTGDAAGFVNAYTGEGIYYALVSGELAGETAADAIAAGDTSAAALARYQARWQAEVGGELADSVRIQQRLFARPEIADAIIRAAALDPNLCRLFARVALGEARLEDHRLQLMIRFAVATVRRKLARS